MATKLYFHRANSTVGGTLPTTTQSGLTINTSTGCDAQTVNRSMDTTISIQAQTSITLTSAANTNTNTYYFTKFVSPPLSGSGTITNAVTWTVSFAAYEDTVSGNFPATTSGTTPVCLYVWRPGNGTKVGNIFSAQSTGNCGEALPAATQAPLTYTFTGASVSYQAGDVLIFEVIFKTTQGNSTPRTERFYFDGTTEASTTDCASFVNNPTDTLSFQGLTRVTTTPTIKYALVARLQDSSTLKYALKALVPTVRTLKYALQKRIPTQSTLNYSLLQRIAKQNTLVYNLAASTPGNTITHNAGDTITWYTPDTEPGLTNWPNGTYTWSLKIINGNPNVELTTLTLLRLNSTRDSILASKSINPEIVLSSNQTYSATIDWNDDTQNPVSKSSSDIFAFTVGTTKIGGSGTQSVTISFDTPDNTRIGTPLVGIKDILTRVLSAKILKYNLSSRLKKSSTIKYSLLYRLAKLVTVKYALRLQVITQKTIKYYLQARVKPIRTIKYALKLRVPSQKTIKYGLKSRLASIKTLEYRLTARLAAQRIIKYKLTARLATLRTLKYGMKARRQIQNTVKYNLLKRIPTLKTLKYALRLKVVTQKTIKYGLKARLQRIETLIYKLEVTGVLTRVATVRIIKYKVTARLQVKPTLIYSLKKRVPKPQTVKYSLRKSVQSLRTVKYALKHRLPSSKTIKYAVRSRLQLSRTLKYSLLKRLPQSPQTLKYSLKRLIPTSKILKYKVSARLKTPRTIKYGLKARLQIKPTIKYSLLKRLPTLRIIKYQLRKTVTTQRTIEYGLKARIKSINTIIYDLFTWGLTRVRSRITLIYELYPRWWLMPRFDKVLENLIRNNYSTDINVINPPKDAISWGKEWGDVGANTRTTLKCEQMPTRLTQLDPPQQVRLESTPVKIKVMHRDYKCKNFRPPALENMENYLIYILWQNVNSQAVKDLGLNHLLPVSYNYVNTDLDGIYELDIIVNLFFFRKIPA